MSAKANAQYERTLSKNPAIDLPLLSLSVNGPEKHLCAQTSKHKKNRTMVVDDHVANGKEYNVYTSKK